MTSATKKSEFWDMVGFGLCILLCGIGIGSCVKLAFSDKPLIVIEQHK